MWPLATSSVVAYCRYVTDAALNATEVSVALERLSIKQKRRQYSAGSLSSDVLSTASVNHCNSTAASNDSVSSHPPKPRRIQSAHAWARQRSRLALRESFYFLFIQMKPPSVHSCCWLGGRKGIRPVKKLVVGCWHGYLPGARCRLAYGPADATASCFSKIQIGFTFLVPAYPGCPGKEAVKWL